MSAKAKLPNLMPPAKPAVAFVWAKRSPDPKPAKAVLPTVQVKKAIKVLKGAGKSLAAIELLPGGGFRVVAKGQGAPAPQSKPPNPWDDWIANDQE
jgi:hypothetical protein